MADKNTDISAYKDFVFFDELYIKHQDLKKKYIQLYDYRFDDLEQVIDEIKEKSLSCEQDASITIETLKSEIKRWRGDREFTSKELSAKLQTAEEQYKNTKRRLEQTERQVGEKNRELVKNCEELTRAKAETVNLKKNLILKHRGEMRELENHFLGKIQSFKTEIKALKSKIDSINEEYSQKTKEFRGTLAENESKWAGEKIDLQRSLRDMLKEVAHWNREALKMENRVRQYEKKLIAAGVGLDFDHAEAKERETQYESLIAERDRLQRDLMETKGKSSYCGNDNRNDISCLESSSLEILSLTNQCKCFTLMTGIKVDMIDMEESADKISFKCKAINHSNTKMLEFNLVYFVRDSKAEFIPARIIDPLGEFPEEFSHRLVLGIAKVPLLLARVLSSVNSED